MNRWPLDLWSWRQAACLLATPVAAFVAFRVAFLATYRDQFAAFGVADLAEALAAGLRFDAAAIAPLVGPPVLVMFALAPLRWRGAIAWAAFGLTLLVTLALSVLLGADLFYFEFAGRHLSFEVFSLSRDAGAITAMAAEGYALPTVLVVGGVAVAGAGAAWILRASLARPRRAVGRLSHGLQTLALALLLVLAARGGWQVKPLSVGAAFAARDMALGHLSLNGAFTVKAALMGRTPEPIHFMPDADALATTRALLGLDGEPKSERFPLLHPLGGERRPTTEADRARPRNVVIIAVESFSAQMTGALGGTPGATPEFDRLAREGLLFRNFYANGTRSVEGVASILTGYPALPGSPVIGSALEQHRLMHLAGQLADSGYSTLFIHGAFRGSMWLDSFAARSGFQRYIAQEDFPDYAAKSDGTWGIFDEYALERLHRELEAAPKPVMAFLFTLGPHTPFRLPDARFRTFAPGEPSADLRNAFAYTDHALGRFFALARRSDYWRDTLFVITGDHNMGRTMERETGSSLDRRAAMWIPLLIVAPGEARIVPGSVSGVLGSQADIAPTVLDLLGWRGDVSFAGQSLLEDRPRRFAMHAWGEQAGWQEDGWMAVLNRGRALALYRPERDPGLTRNLLKSRAGREQGQVVIAHARAYWQAVNNLLLENRVAPPR